MAIEEVVFKEFNKDLIDEVKAIYKNEGWTAYLGDDDKLKTAFDRSLFILGAFSHGKLLAYIRCLGDGEHLVLIQDLIVDIPYRRMKLGKELYDRVCEKYKGARTIILITDLMDEVSNSFYKSLGMDEIKDRNMVTYIR